MVKKEEKLLTANVNETAKWWGWFEDDITWGFLLGYVKRYWVGMRSRRFGMIDVKLLQLKSDLSQS